MHDWPAADLPVTVAPRYNEDPVIMNNIGKPGRITVKYVETNSAIMNPAIMNRF